MLFGFGSSIKSQVRRGMMAKVAILGTRGIPARYGGFETFADRLAIGLTEHGYDVTVYCEEEKIPGIEIIAELNCDISLLYRLVHCRRYYMICFVCGMHAGDLMLSICLATALLHSVLFPGCGELRYGSTRTDWNGRAPSGDLLQSYIFASWSGVRLFWRIGLLPMRKRFNLLLLTAMGRFLLVR